MSMAPHIYLCSSSKKLSVGFVKIACISNLWYRTVLSEILFFCNFQKYYSLYYHMFFYNFHCLWRLYIFYNTWTNCILGHRCIPSRRTRYCSKFLTLVCYCDDGDWTIIYLFKVNDVLSPDCSIPSLTASMGLNLRNRQQNMLDFFLLPVFQWIIIKNHHQFTLKLGSVWLLGSIARALP